MRDFQQSQLFRRQFLMSDFPCESFAGWTQTELSCGLFLQNHPELELTQVSLREKHLTLLGYVFDSQAPLQSNREVLEELLNYTERLPEFFKYTSRFSGRWILMVDLPEHQLIFHDPAGLRSVFYTEEAPFYFASQPGLLKTRIPLTLSPEVQRDYLNSDYYANDREAWLPGGTSLYSGVKQLPPNHYYDLKTKKTVRFWPWSPLESQSLETVAEQAALLLKNLMLAASKRFDLALPMTAGWDSRTLLAASKTLKEQLYCYTLIYYKLTPKSPDIYIPRQLLKIFEMEHHLLDCSSAMSPAFQAFYERNVDHAHQALGNIVEGVLKNYPQEKVCVKGNCSEIARCYYYPETYPKVITAQTLAQLAEMEHNAFAVRHFGQWLREGQVMAKTFKLNILDLFYWEHRMGSWLSMSLLEWDCAQETYIPFNCRDLLDLLLSVDQKYRRPPDYKLYETMIGLLWKEVLSAPINPETFLNQLKPKAKKRLRQMGVYNTLKTIKNKISG
ncbi:hypothetical protein WDW89_25705 [Deltaproteobacteria bacterium TL4]